jgi:hypothetical protein
MPLPAPHPARRFALESLGLSHQFLATEPLDGGGVVAWLSVAPAAVAVRGAMCTSGLRIEESGTVSRLHVHNRTDRPVLIPADWILEGGKQSRVVERSVILGPHALADVPVRCVESRRWEHRLGGDPDAFSMTGPATTGSRTTFIRAREAHLREQGSYGLDQGVVWTHVSAELERTSTHSRTDSYVDFLRGAHVEAAEPARQVVERMPADANGLLALDGMGRGWFEVFPGPEELRLVAVTAIASVTIRGLTTDRDTHRDLDAGLDAVWGATLVTVGMPVGTLGEHLSLRGSGVWGALLLFAGDVAHMAARVELRA